ncbi:MAG: DedA family protein/thiosulfate sulfurtransferase GlpE [Nitrospirota bacterium]|nr:DedA family protein/thiosulfate sulfurtransferase GlpE [Nitrospirota bacterium]
MNEAAEFLLHHGESVLFWVVFAEQIGLPIPAIPLLIAAGALAGAGTMSVWAAVSVPILASLGPDLFWYYLGRHRGGRVLSLLCRISLEPDSCVRRTEQMFFLHGVRTLIVAKFVPGLSTVAPPLAGMFNMSLRRFLLYDGLGALLWSGTCVGLGWLFSSQLERLALLLAQAGAAFLQVLVGAFVVYLGYKVFQRQLFLRELRMARITVDELRERLEAGEEVAIVDLRHPMDLEIDPHMIPGAWHMPMEELERRHHEIPRDRDIVLYCACPNEVTSARTALMLKRKGITRVRPLEGGIDAWRERNYPVEARPSPAAAPTVAIRG